jgi:excinuclease ABC subunit B
VLVGINLLREGLDLPEVSLVAILDADKEGFLRSGISLIQTIGRAARNINGRVIMYADNITGSIKNAVDETERRRKIQIEFNDKNNIVPRSISKAISDILYERGVRPVQKSPGKKDNGKVSDGRLTESRILKMDPSNVFSIISGLEEKMYLEARELNFEKAAVIRDEIKRIKKITNIQTPGIRKDEGRNIYKRRKRA